MIVFRLLWFHPLPGDGGRDSPSSHDRLGEVGETIAGNRFRRLVVVVVGCPGGCCCPPRQDNGRGWCVGDVGGLRMLLVIMLVGLADKLRSKGWCCCRAASVAENDDMVDFLLGGRIYGGQD
jgi:hypothetical protein